MIPLQSSFNGFHEAVQILVPCCTLFLCSSAHIMSLAHSDLCRFGPNLKLFVRQSLLPTQATSCPPQFNFNDQRMCASFFYHPVILHRNTVTACVGTGNLCFPDLSRFVSAGQDPHEHQAKHMGVELVFLRGYLVRWRRLCGGEKAADLQCTA